MAADQPGSESRQTFSLFFILSSLLPPVFVCADIVLARLYSYSPPFFPQFYVVAALTELTLTPLPQRPPFFFQSACYHLNT